VPDLAFALDENVAHAVASLLRSHGQDATSARELSRLGISDVQVLVRAAEEGQTLVTHNSKDFRALHEAWVTWRRHWAREVEQVTGRPVDLSHHAGILITPHLPNHDLARILEEFEDSVGSIDDRLFAWSPARRWHELHF
jgi:Domain of unknown function (DUF5615)